MPDNAASGSTRPMRFGVVAPIQTDLPAWRDQVRRIADHGYSTLLMPDVQQWQPAPGPTLAVAATLAPGLRVGTWVYASPLRPSWSLAWEAHSLSVLTDGRFELGIGTGRPGMEDELRELNLPVLSPAERLSQVRDAITALRDLDGPSRTPVVMAVRGPKARALAAELADTVTFAATPDDSRADIVAMALGFRASPHVELALHVAVVGDAVSAFMAPSDTEPAALHAADSLMALPTDPRAIIDELQRRRDEAGFSYFVIGANSADALAPVVAELSGR